MGVLVRAIAENGSAVCYAMESTDIAAQAERIHQTSAVVTAALGRLMTAASIMGAMLKGEKDSVTLRITADGEIGSLIAVSDAGGNVRGYVTNPVVELPLNPYGKLDVSGAVGKNGSLYVIRDVGLKEPYMGMVPLVSGEIAEDITNYFAVSEQIPTVCALGVLVAPDLTVRAAGGFIAQLLPGAAESDIEALEQSVGVLPSVTQMLNQGVTARELAERVLAGLSPQILDETPVKYRCGCSRERVENALLSLNAEELRSMAAEDHGAQVHCHFCPKVYRFSEKELLSLAEQKTVDKEPKI